MAVHVKFCTWIDYTPYLLSNKNLTPEGLVHMTRSIFWHLLMKWIELGTWSLEHRTQQVLNSQQMINYPIKRCSQSNVAYFKFFWDTCVFLN